MPWKTEFALKFFTALKYFYLSGFLRKLRLPWKQSLSWNFSLCLIYFLHSGCLSKFCLLWETECAPNQLYWMYFLSFRILNNLRLPWKTEFALKIFTALNIVFTFRIFEQLALALKNRICPEIFHCIEIFFIFQDFWATWSCPENRVCPKFFKPGGRLPPRLVRHWSSNTFAKTEFLIEYIVVKQRNSCCNQFDFNVHFRCLPCSQRVFSCLIVNVARLLTHTGIVWRCALLPF